MNPASVSRSSQASTVQRVVAARAQDHTLIMLSHSNHTVYEIDPATGKALHEFVAADQPPGSGTT